MKDLVAFCCDEGLSAWPLDDQVVIEYTASLIKEGATVSKLESGLEACNFARFVLGVDVVGEVMGRLRRARLFRAQKERCRYKRAFSSSHSSEIRLRPRMTVLRQGLTCLRCVAGREWGILQRCILSSATSEKGAEEAT